MTTYDYSIARYVNDIIKNEPVNIGLIIKERRSEIYFGNFIPNFKALKNRYKDANLSLLKIVIDTFEGEHKSSISLSDLSKNFGNQLQFTSPRSLDAKNVTVAINELHDDFISIYDIHAENDQTPQKHDRLFLRRYVQNTINTLKFKKENYEKDYELCYNKRSVLCDFIFKNGKIQDTINVIPITKHDPKKSRNHATTLATDIRYIKKNKNVEDVTFNILMRNMGNTDEHNNAYDKAKIDLEESGCKIILENALINSLSHIRNKLYD